MVLAGCVSEVAAPPVTQAASFAEVTTRSDFISSVTGRQISEGDGQGGFFIMNADGTLEGVAEGNAYTGTWTWENGMWCRAFDRDTGQTASKCRSVAVNTDTIRFIKPDDEGGEVQVYQWI